MDDDNKAPANGTPRPLQDRMPETVAKPLPTAPRERPTPEGDGLDPTRYLDWEKNGRCIDF